MQVQTRPVAKVVQLCFVFLIHITDKTVQMSINKSELLGDFE